MKYLEVKGERLPVVGFGTSGLHGRKCTRMTRYALDVGYRHIDTAQGYGNEAAVGAALAETDVPREQIFLTTKIWTADFGLNDLPRAADDSLRALGTDYVDLLLLHWPDDRTPMEETLTALERVRASGKTRHIGVGNFTMRHMTEALDTRGAELFCNQIEYHVRLAGAQQRMLAFLRDRGIALVAYSPLGRGLLTSSGALARIGVPYGKSAAQVALRWLAEQDGVALITRSGSEKHCRESLEIFDFELSEQDRAAIAALDDGTRVINPGWAPAWDE